MHKEPAGHSLPAASGKQPAYPLHKVVAAVEPARVEQMTAALAAAGLDGDRVEIVTAADVPALDEPIGGTGLRGFFERLGLSLGDDLDALQQARSELSQGHVLVFVDVPNDAARERVHDLLREHGGHSMRYFGNWTITTLEGGAH